MLVSCQCGTLTFTTPTPLPTTLYHCHCLECRRQSGSAFGTSAIFPSFSLPELVPSSQKEYLGVWTRNTDSGGVMDCYFCKKCGSRLVHARRGGETVSVKGGVLVEGDGEKVPWDEAKHIYWKRRVVGMELRKGTECFEGDPEF